jgi:hypothetical protein
MPELQGTLIIADGRRIAGLSIRLDEHPRFWSGSLLVPPDHRTVLLDVFRRRMDCQLHLADGRTGTIRLIGLGSITQLEGVGPLA